MGIIDFVRELIALTDNVNRLRSDFGELVKRVEENRERIIKLETCQKTLSAEIAEKTRYEVKDFRADFEQRVEDRERALFAEMAQKVTQTLSDFRSNIEQRLSTLETRPSRNIPSQVISPSSLPGDTPKSGDSG